MIKIFLTCAIKVHRSVYKFSAWNLKDRISSGYSLAMTCLNLNSKKVFEALNIKKFFQIDIWLSKLSVLFWSFSNRYSEPWLSTKLGGFDVTPPILCHFWRPKHETGSKFSFECALKLGRSDYFGEKLKKKNRIERRALDHF